MSTNDARLVAVCAALTGATLLSWWLGISDGHHAFTLNAGITFGVVLVAAIKVRLIVWEFMELKHAPARMRRVADASLATLIAVLLVLYCAGSL